MPKLAPLSYPSPRLKTTSRFPRREFLIQGTVGSAGLLLSELLFSSRANASLATQKALNALLQKAVKTRRVDYNVVRANVGIVQNFVQDLSTAKAPSRGHKALAFYINAYNILVLDSVLQASLDLKNGRVLEVKGFFKKKLHTVAGEKLTLDGLEGKYIRNQKDPRIHFAVNCASVDCPPLRNVLYSAASLSVDLDRQCSLYLQKSSEIIVNKAEKSIQIVQLFEWFQQDFGGEQGVRNFIARYRPDVKEVKDASYKLTYRPYDWGLNAAL